MTRFLLPSLLLSLSGALVLGACTDTTSPKTPPAAPPGVAQERVGGNGAARGFTLDESAVEEARVAGTVGGTATVSKSSSSISPDHAAFCFRGHCIQIVDDGGNFVFRVLGRTRATGFGCGRYQLYINGFFARQTNVVCHGTGDVVFTRYVFNRRFPFGTQFCEFARGPGVPHIGVCQRL